RSSGMLHGVNSFQLDATPTWALPQSSSVMPTARSIARAPARSIPSVTSKLCGFIFSGIGKGAYPWAMSVLVATSDGYHIFTSSGKHLTALEGRALGALVPGPDDTWVAIVDRREV